MAIVEKLLPDIVPAEADTLSHSRWWNQLEKSEAANRRVLNWYESKGWKPFRFQSETWDSYLAGNSGLVHSATGTGKTLAVLFGPILEWLLEQGFNSDSANRTDTPLTLLWITPLKALANDTFTTISQVVEELQIPWSVGIRTGDTSATERRRQTVLPPTILVTTPESFSLQLTREDVRERLKSVKCVVVDEWHELMSSKRGVSLELCLATLRSICPAVRTWGVSATLANIDEAGKCLVGVHSEPILIESELSKATVIETLLPESLEEFPWAGHFGTLMIPQVVRQIEQASTTLVFLNTRAQAEIWFNRMIAMYPDLKPYLAIHHGSMDPGERAFAELGLKTGKLKAVISTSSLDLGVDFSPVDQVIQVGSPKGVARLLQRAGRSGHQPGRSSKIYCVPTYALELVDIAAARRGAELNLVEPREEIEAPLDVLVQHLVTLSLNGQMSIEEVKRQVLSTQSFRNLTEPQWNWCLSFINSGGASLGAYPDFHRVSTEGGKLVVSGTDIARRHRLSIGTIVSDPYITVQYLSGKKLGNVEESFISKLSIGDRFVFAGKILQFVRFKDLTAYVKPANSKTRIVPHWAGGRLPLSNELAASIRQVLSDYVHGRAIGPELKAISPVLKCQVEVSAVPDSSELLVELLEDEDGYHSFIYPIDGRIVHEGLAALFAYRLTQQRQQTISFACNDNGFELVSDQKIMDGREDLERLLSSENLREDLQKSINSVEMARRQFREIARIAGLVFEGMPGKAKSMKHIQASSGLFFDVFRQFEPTNQLYQQAFSEVFDQQLEETRLFATLARMQKSGLKIMFLTKPSPFAMPILVDRLRDSVTSEDLEARIQKMRIEYADTFEHGKERTVPRILDERD